MPSPSGSAVLPEMLAFVRSASEKWVCCQVSSGVRLRVNAGRTVKLPVMTRLAGLLVPDSAPVQPVN